MAVEINFEFTSCKWLQNITFCDVLHESKQKRKQTLESAQYGLEIIFKGAVSRNLSKFIKLELVTKLSETWK